MKGRNKMGDEESARAQAVGKQDQGEGAYSEDGKLLFKYV